MLSRHCSVTTKSVTSFGRFSFATAQGNGISDPKNPKVFFKVSKNGAPIGEIQFEVILSFPYFLLLALCK